MALIIDASIAVAWCADRQATKQTEAALIHVATHGMRVPAHWGIEVSSSLLALERHARLAPSDVQAFWRDLRAIAVAVEAAPDISDIETLLRLGRLFGLTTADAAYLDLAIRTELPLATRDRALASAAAKAGVPLFEA